jgi:flagellar hook-length control protein FliK
MARATEHPWTKPEPLQATTWRAETHAWPLAEDVTTHITADAADASGAVPDADEPGSHAVVPAESQRPAAAAVALLRGRMGQASSPDTGLTPTADLTRPLPAREASGPRAVLTLAQALRPHAPVALASDADIGPDGRLTASALETTLDAELQPQLIDAIRVQARSGVQEARIRLRPDVLGEVSMVIAVTGGVVSATLEAESPLVRHWMERHEGLLRERLSEQGLQLAHFDVKADERPRDGERQRREPRDAPPPQMMTRAQRERAARRFAAML